MSNLLYFIAVILIIIWVAGHFVFNAGALIHVLPVIAVFTVFLRVIGARRRI